MLDTADTWKTPIVIISADIQSAFDSMRHEDILQSMKDHHIPDKLIAAFARELALLIASATLEGITSAQDAKYRRGVRRGGTEGPFQWNLATDSILKDCVKEWQRKGYGINTSDNTRITNLFWADNFFIVTRHLSEARNMMQCLTRCITRHRLRWKSTSLQI